MASFTRQRVPNPFLVEDLLIRLIVSKKQQIEKIGATKQSHLFDDIGVIEISQCQYRLHDL